jgi:integrase
VLGARRRRVIRVALAFDYLPIHSSWAPQPDLGAHRGLSVKTMEKTITDKPSATYPNIGSEPWNKGKPIGAKPPLRPKHVWAIRTKLQLERDHRDLALFNLAIDSKLRGCDVVAIRVEDVAPRGYAVDRAIVRQRKTGSPVKFELTEQTREAVDGYLKKSHRVPGQYLFRLGPDRRKPSRRGASSLPELGYHTNDRDWLVAGLARHRRRCSTPRRAYRRGRGRRGGLAFLLSLQTLSSA